MSLERGRKRSQAKLTFKIQTVGVIWLKLYLQLKKKKKKLLKKTQPGHIKLDSQED